MLGQPMTWAWAITRYLDLPNVHCNGWCYPGPYRPGRVARVLARVIRRRLIDPDTM